MSRLAVRNHIRSVTGTVLRRRLIRARERFLQTAQTSCRDVQRETLRRLLALNQDSEFSKRFGLGENLSIRDYQRQLPMTDYEFFRPYVDRMRHGEHTALLGPENRLRMFAVSSGTTAEPKLIPITDRFVQDYRRGWQHWGIGAYQDHPQLKHSRMVQIVSRHDRFRTEDGTPCGNISGLVTSMQKRIVQGLYTIPAVVREVDCLASKRKLIARFALADPTVGMFVTANPGTLAQLMATVSPEAVIRDIHDGTTTDIEISASTSSQLKRHVRPNRRRARELRKIADTHGSLVPAECWPDLDCLAVWCGGSAGAYVPQLQRIFGSVAIRDHGLHASEGRMTVPLCDHSPTGLLDIDTHFFEFIPVEEAESERPNVLLADELQEGCDYYILLTTSSGLYRYNIRDVVRCTGFFGTTPLLEFRHKGAHMSNIAGEKISESQVVEAVTAACRSQNTVVRQFTLTPAWGEPPFYRLLTEADPDTAAASSLSELAAACDLQLRQQNCEYDEKRTSQRLGEIRCEEVPNTVWEQFARNRLAASGGSPEQYKHPCLLPDPEFEDRFMRTSAAV